MHSRVFIIWLAATISTTSAANESTELRRPRQLDLGPDTNTLGGDQTTASPRQSNFQPQGYLPPIEPAGAADDPVRIKPTEAPRTPTHHGRDLCTDPFHSFLCANLKPRRPITGNLPGQKKFELSGNFLSGANSFLEPSKVLAPPLNDLEEVFTTTTRRPQPPTTTTTRATTTTRRPTTAAYRPPPTTTRRATSPTTTTTERNIGPEASNDVRNYLPPDRIDPAAANPDIAVVKPDPSEEHHHHPHHHGRDLCTDPFHSFLCTPLKPRKRITGDVPNSLQGQNTFVNPQKVRPDPEVSPEPSNEIDRAYLPPSTTRRPTTTQRIIPQPSNSIENAYLPPSTTRRPTTTRRPPPPPPIIPQPSNEIERAYLPPTTTTRRPPPPPPPPPRIIPQPSNAIDRAYLPPSTTTRRPPPPPTTTRRPPPTTTIRFRPEPSNEITRSYLPPVTTTRRPTTTPRPAPPVVPQPSNVVDRSYLPPIAPQPSNVDNTFLRPEPKIEPAAAQNDLSVAAPDHDHDHHHHGSHGFKDICSDPFHSFLCVSPKPRKRITGELPARFRVNAINPAPSNIDENRVRILEHKAEKLRIVVIPKDEESPQPSQQQDTKIPFPTNVFPNYDYPKPKLPLASEVKEVGYSYPKPTTPKPTPTEYFYPKPDNKLTLPSETKEVIGYDYPKPAKPFPADKGYSYPQPDNKLTLPSEVKVNYQKPTTPRVTTTTTIKPTTTTVSYTYPKPENKLPLPSETKEVVGYDYPKPSVTFPTPTKGYSYDKPDVQLTLPSGNQPNKGYDYPKPVNGLRSPTQEYPKPTGELRLATQDYRQPKEGFALPTQDYRQPKVGFGSPTQDYPQPKVGFGSPTQDYRQPKVGFGSPTQDYPQPNGGLPLPSNDYPKPEGALFSPIDQRNIFNTATTLTNAQRIANSYAKPKTPSSTSKTLLPTNIQEARERLQPKKVGSVSSQSNLSDFIPVNKVEFPSEGELGVRFGERLKRRERGRHLVPPAGSSRL